jgi:hypothetical protein
VTPLVKIDEPLSEYRLHGANSYGSPRISTEFLRREISICRHLWQAQREFLERRGAALAAQLESVEHSFFIVYLNYLEARLSRRPSERACHAELMKGLREKPDARFVKFWSWSIHLPVFVFDFAINLISRQSLLKQVLSRLKGLL